MSNWSVIWDLDTFIVFLPDMFGQTIFHAIFLEMKTSWFETDVKCSGSIWNIPGWNCCNCSAPYTVFFLPLWCDYMQTLILESIGHAQVHMWPCSVSPRKKEKRNCLISCNPLHFLESFSYHLSAWWRFLLFRVQVWSTAIGLLLATSWCQITRRTWHQMPYYRMEVNIFLTSAINISSKD